MFFFTEEDLAILVPYNILEYRSDPYGISTRNVSGLIMGGDLIQVIVGSPQGLLQGAQVDRIRYGSLPLHTERLRQDNKE